MPLISLIILVVWALFWVYWFIKATDSKKNLSIGIKKGIGFRLGILILAVVTIRLESNNLRNFNFTNLNDHNLAFEVIGLIVFISGLALAIWARAYLGRNWGMPMSEKHNPELITAGPYKYIRHPIYTGIITGFLGTAIAINISLLLIFFFASTYFIYSATKEEQYLARKFPKTFLKYKKTSKMLIPFIL